MFAKLGIKLAKWLLSSGNLSIEDSASLTSLIMNKIGALPYRDVISYNEQGVLTIDGVPLNMEEAVALRSSASVALNNKALKYIFEQIQYMAVVSGVHKGQTVEQMYFGRTAIWNIQNIQKALETLAGKEEGGIM